jgi:Trypsin
VANEPLQKIARGSGTIHRETVARAFGTSFVVVLASMFAAAAALGVVGGRTITIKAAPWSVVVWEAYAPGRSYAACTGVIIDSRHVLTAGHCVMQGESAKPLPLSAFRIEAGVSNFKHPLPSDDPQSRAVSAVRVMPGYIALRGLTVRNWARQTGHDLAVLTLTRPLDLNGPDARAAALPTALPDPTPRPTATARLVIAGYGDEKPRAGVRYQTGRLNEIVRATARKSCSTSQRLCLFATSKICFGDSGAGAVEPGPHPTVLGIFSSGRETCRSGFGYYVPLTAPSVLRFIDAAMQTPHFHGTPDASAGSHKVIQPLPAIVLVSVMLGVLGVWRIRDHKERRGR